jgi:hypothetical protein
MSSLPGAGLVFPAPTSLTSRYGTHDANPRRIVGLGGHGLDRGYGPGSSGVLFLAWKHGRTTTGGLGSRDQHRISRVSDIVLHLDLSADVVHVTDSRTLLGWLDEKGEHAPLAPLHVLRGHVRGEDKPVVGHDNPFGQDLIRKLNVTCVRCTLYRTQ